MTSLSHVKIQYVYEINADKVLWYVKGVACFLQTPFPMPTRPWAEHTQTNLFTPCKHCRWETTKYAKLRPANIHLARWDQINDIENNEDGGGLVQYFRGRKRQQTRVGIVWLASCLSVSVILPCNVNKDFWLWGSNCSNVLLNKLMVWLPNSHDLLKLKLPQILLSQFLVFWQI